MKSQDRVKKSSQETYYGGANNRRIRARQRLEAQLKRGNKTEHKTGNVVPLTDKDKERIAKEIEILKNK